MYMPLMVDIKRAVVFGGERGEGLQKTQKMAVFADELLVVPETAQPYAEIVVEKGHLTEVKEKLDVRETRRIPVAPVAAASNNLEEFIRGANFVTSDLVDRKLNEEIRSLCDRWGILCNIIDTKDLCNTWFMSLIKTPWLTVALSSEGGCAYYSVRTREELQSEIETRAEVSHILTDLRSSLPRGPQREKTLDAVYRDKQFQKLVKNELWEEARKHAFSPHFFRFAEE